MHAQGPDGQERHLRLSGRPAHGPRAPRLQRAPYSGGEPLPAAQRGGAATTARGEPGQPPQGRGAQGAQGQGAGQGAGGRLPHVRGE